MIQSKPSEKGEIITYLSRMGDVLRQLMNGFAPKEMPPPDYYSMMRELHAIGNRMNQIAARANATGFFLAEDYARDVAELRAAILKIQSAVTLPEKTG